MLISFKNILHTKKVCKLVHTQLKLCKLYKHRKSVKIFQFTVRILPLIFRFYIQRCCVFESETNIRDWKIVCMAKTNLCDIIIILLFAFRWHHHVHSTVVRPFL